MSYKIHIGPNIRTSPYFEATLAEGVSSFSVYNHMYIPGSFGDADAEYRRLIEGVAMWDVAAQRQVEISGPDAVKLVQLLSTRNVADMKIGQGRYTCICDPDGLLLNDPVLLKLAEDRFWFSIADSDIALWAAALAHGHGLNAKVSEPDASPMAVQGPMAKDVIVNLFGDWAGDLKYFWFKATELDGIPLVLARSGWSKQDGFELYLLDHTRGSDLWAKVREAGQPFGIGPGAPNDAERIESGLISYGADMRHQRNSANPFEMEMGKFVDLAAPIDFIGRAALQSIAEKGADRRLVGVFLEGPQITPNAAPFPIMQGDAAVGTVSEVTHSPRLQRNIGLALVNANVGDEGNLHVMHDGRTWPITLTDLPFIKGA